MCSLSIYLSIYLTLMNAMDDVIQIPYHCHPHSNPLPLSPPPKSPTTVTPTQRVRRPLFQNLTVYISGARQPGEGELKIVDWLQSRIPLTDSATNATTTAAAAAAAAALAPTRTGGGSVPVTATGSAAAAAAAAAATAAGAGAGPVGAVGGGRLARRHSLDTVVVCGSDSGE